MVSNEYAVLLKWEIYIMKSPTKERLLQNEFVRLGLVQWQMRPYKDFHDLMQQAEYFVDTLSGYKSDFALFPEFFNAPLMAEFNH